MELVEHDPRLRGRVGDRLDIGGRHVDRHGLKLGAPRGAERVEEAAQGLGALALRRPDDPLAPMIDDNRDVLVVLAVGKLVHADVGQVLEPVLRAESIDDPLDDRPDGRPGDAHHLDDDALGRVLGKVSRRLLEVAREPRACLGPRHHLHHDAALRAIDAPLPVNKETSTVGRLRCSRQVFRVRIRVGNVLRCRGAVRVHGGAVVGGGRGRRRCGGAVRRDGVAVGLYGGARRLHRGAASVCDRVIRCRWVAGRRYGGAVRLHGEGIVMWGVARRRCGGAGRRDGGAVRLRGGAILRCGVAMRRCGGAVRRDRGAVRLHGEGIAMWEVAVRRCGGAGRREGGAVRLHGEGIAMCGVGIRRCGGAVRRDGGAVRRRGVGRPLRGVAGSLHGAGKPFTSSGKPFTSLGKPFTSSGKPFTSLGKPFTSSGKPFTSSGNGWCGTDVARRPAAGVERGAAVAGGHVVGVRFGRAIEEAVPDGRARGGAGRRGGGAAGRSRSGSRDGATPGCSRRRACPMWSTRRWRRRRLRWRSFQRSRTATGRTESLCSRRRLAGGLAAHSHRTRRGSPTGSPRSADRTVAAMPLLRLFHARQAGRVRDLRGLLLGGRRPRHRLPRYPFRAQSRDASRGTRKLRAPRRVR